MSTTTSSGSHKPIGWEAVPLGELVVSEKGKKPKQESTERTAEFSIPYIDIEAFEQGVVKSWTNGNGCRLCHETDFLMVWDGSRSGLVGKGMFGALGSTLVRINFPQIHNNYAYYFLQSKFAEINSRAKGVGIPHVDPNLLWNYQFPIPPLNEQKRIVEKIEELFSELDKSIESLKTARAQLKVYRQAILKHAFEGKLTADWRDNNQGGVETAYKLLNTVKQQRDTQARRKIDEWNSEIRRWENSGRKGNKPTKPRSLSISDPLSTEELSKLPKLPHSWQWCKVGQLFKVYVGSTPSRKNANFWNGSIPWVSSGEVAFCKIYDTKERITQEGYVSISAERHPVETVMLAMIGEGKTRGQAAILNIEATHNQNTAAIRVSETGCSALLFYYYLLYQYELTRRLGSGNNQKALNKDRVSNIRFPLMPIQEQNEVVHRIQSQLSIIENMEQTIDDQLQKSRSLYQSILQKAFSGQLVAHDPADEPASVLLERIRVEKENVSDKKLKTKRRAA